ncbi:MAG: succinate dehydrogenase [Bacteroidales bacterium]|nr:succinate dehydrogenase [Bacteroidales bacterium]
MQTKSIKEKAMFIFNSSIGKKFIQSISGAFLLLFLLLHGTINFFSVIDTFTGKYGVVANDDILFSEGDGLFKLGCDFMSLPIVSIMVPVLALGFLVHIIYGCWLTYENIKARGGVKRYEVSSKAAADSWSARNMFVLGLVILGLLLFHLTHFWAKMQLPELFGIGNYENNPYLLLNATFGHWWILAIYILWFVAIFLHLSHGFWSMLQTIGWNSQVWFNRVKVIGIVVAALIFLMFTAVAVNAFIQANFLMA